MKLQLNQTVYYNFDNKKIIECVIDDINGPELTLHVVKKNAGPVYTARVFTCDVSEYGTKFALTKQELQP